MGETLAPDTEDQQHLSRTESEQPLSDEEALARALHTRPMGDIVGLAPGDYERFKVQRLREGGVTNLVEQTIRDQDRERQTLSLRDLQAKGVMDRPEVDELRSAPDKAETDEDRARAKRALTTISTYEPIVDTMRGELQAAADSGDQAAIDKLTKWDDMDARAAERQAGYDEYISENAQTIDKIVANAETPAYKDEGERNAAQAAKEKAKAEAEKAFDDYNVRRAAEGLKPLDRNTYDKMARMNGL